MVSSGAKLAEAAKEMNHYLRIRRICLEQGSREHLIQAKYMEKLLDKLSREYNVVINYETDEIRTK